MATRTCPTCGSQYVASVRRCISCDVLLVDEVVEDEEVPTVDAGASTPIGEGEHIGYELEGWGNQLKVTLEGMLDRAGVPRAWEGGALVVPAAQEQVVDELIASVEGADEVSLDPDVDQVAFEIEGLDPDGLDELDGRLLAEGIAHAWSDDGDLLVALADDERVSAIIEEVIEGEVGDGGETAMEALSDLYVAVDRLMKDPLDARLGARTSEAGERLVAAALPYGFSTDVWAEIQQEAGALVALLARDEDEDEDDDEDEDVPDRGEEGDEDGTIELPDPDEADEALDELLASIHVEGDDADDQEDLEDDDQDEDEDDEDDDDEDDDGPATRAERIAAAARGLRSRLLEYV